jgi:hypothetical protein
MKKKILADRSNYRHVIEETQYEFTIHVLLSIGIPESSLQECFPEGGYNDFTAKHKIALRNLLKKFDTTIIDDRDGDLKIYVGDQMVGHWKKSKFYLKRDKSKLRKEEQLYIEIHCDFWMSSEGEKNV